MEPISSQHALSSSFGQAGVEVTYLGLFFNVEYGRRHAERPQPKDG